jgi:LacI family transcriptional regulator
MPPKRNSRSITIRDIAEKSGFSPSTVSIVLNRAPLSNCIPDGTKQKIQNVARDLGYTPNQLARSLRNQRNQTLGVMVFDITDPFCTPVIRGVESTLYHANHLGIFTDVHNDPVRFEHSLAMLLERRIEGLIVIANWLSFEIGLLAELENKSVPTVTIGRKLRDSVSSVLVDNEAGACLGIEHLHKLGHREIAFIRGPKDIGDTAQRWAGIRSFARSCGLTIDHKLVVDLPHSEASLAGFETGLRLTDDLLRRGRRFTAVMAFDDVTALGAMRALINAGIKVPDDCSVIGFDDTLPAAMTYPSLTTIRQPMEAIGAAAVEIVLDALKSNMEGKEFAPVHRRLMPELVQRESTGKAK